MPSASLSTYFMASTGRYLFLLLVSISIVASSEVAGQTMTAGRTLVDIQPVADQCQVQTCVEATATRSAICAVQVLDNSGSMNTNSRFIAAQTGITEFVDSLDADRGDYFGLLTFSGPSLAFGGVPLANPGSPSIDLQVGSPTQDFDAAKGIIAGLSTAAVSSLTPLAAGISAGAQILEGCPENSLPVMVVSTDGLPNWDEDVQCRVSPTADTGCTDAAVGAAESAKANGIHIVTIGIDLRASDASEAFGIDLLQEIASSPIDANFFNTADGLGQADIFTHVARSTASPSNVRFGETLPDACWGYVPGSASGSVSNDPEIAVSDGIQTLTWNLATLPDGETADLCYSMGYDPSCGSSPASVSVESGGASWQRTDGTESFVDFGSQSIDAIKECRIVIPVELIAFKVVSSGRDVTLQWKTASEIDNAGFGIERSRVGGPFKEVAYVGGHGNSLVTQEYRFVDRSVTAGSHRYRLRQVDFDGTFEYSPTVEVQVGLPEAYFMGSVYPNPVRTHASFELAVARQQMVRVDVLDAVGRTIQTIRNAPMRAGSTESISVDAGELPAGIYLIRVLGEYFSTATFATVAR